MWEYLTSKIDLNSNGKIKSKLDKFGEEGWELVCMVNNIFIFKRPILEEDSNKTSEHLACKYGGYCDYKQQPKEGTKAESLCTKSFKNNDTCPSACVLENQE